MKPCRPRIKRKAQGLMCGDLIKSQFTVLIAFDIRDTFITRSSFTSNSIDITTNLKAIHEAAFYLHGCICNNL